MTHMLPKYCHLIPYIVMYMYITVQKLSNLSSDNIYAHFVCKPPRSTKLVTEHIYRSHYIECHKSS